MLVLLLAVTVARAGDAPVADRPDESSTLPLAVPTPLPEVPDRPYRWSGLALPLLGFTSTDGFGMGVGGELFDLPRVGEGPPRDRLRVSTYWAVTGSYSSSQISYERQETHAFSARFLYRTWSDMLYVGTGGEDVLLRRDRDVAGGNVLSGPQIQVGGSFQFPRVPLRVWVQAYGRYAMVTPKAGGLLDLEAPAGSTGGGYWDTSTGVTIQEVDRWPLPRKGVRAEASVRFGALHTDDDPFAPLVGVNVEGIGWWPIVGDRLVLGGRIVIDKTWGTRPFWEQEWLGGEQRDEVAYDQAFTGYGRTRTRGDGHVALLTELRSLVVRSRHPIWDIGFYVSAYAEAAWAFDGDEPGPVLPTVGVAPYLVYQGTTRLRPYVSWGWMADEPGGVRTGELQVGLALVEPL